MLKVKHSESIKDIILKSNNNIVLKVSKFDVSKWNYLKQVNVKHCHSNKAKKDICEYIITEMVKGFLFRKE